MPIAARARGVNRRRGVETVGTIWYWVGFAVFVAAMLALDLGVFHRRAHTISIREASLWTAVWIALALLFAGGVFVRWGPETGQEWITGYVIEKALSVDNLFVFYVIFASLRVRPEVQHRLLFWGILGAIVLRTAMVFGGTWLLQTVHWVIYVFGAILVLSGVRMFQRHDEEADPRKGRTWRWITRLVPTTREEHGAQLIARENGALLATPLLLVLVLIELTDVVFAIDSILAIFAVTTDPFIVLTSNVFAVMGLRSLYFVLAGAARRFEYLQPGLAMVLIFVGAKMLLSGIVHVPVLVSLAVVAVLLAGSIAASMIKTRWSARRRAPPPDAGDGKDGGDRRALKAG